MSDTLHGKLGRTSTNPGPDGPMKSTPYDILVEIFQCLNQINPLMFAFQSSLNGVPSVLLVCKLWQKAALSTPSLWARFKIDCPELISLPRLQKRYPSMSLSLSSFQFSYPTTSSFLWRSGSFC